MHWACRPRSSDRSARSCSTVCIRDAVGGSRPNLATTPVKPPSAIDRGRGFFGALEEVHAHPRALKPVQHVWFGETARGRNAG
jgi:hypothetical protein